MEAPQLIRSRGSEIFLGLVLFVVGAFLLWDATDGRNQPLPWPLGAVLPW